MKLLQLLERQITDEMRKHFETRTNKHIQLVRKYCERVPDSSNKYYHFLQERAEKHDQSKFEEPEITPYIYLTWQYKMKDDGKEFILPQEIKDSMNNATLFHVTHNSHHPEFHASNNKTMEILNRDDRDKPTETTVDATSMPDIDIAEMVADWCAMSEERGNSPTLWADKNINVRWKFTKDQTDLIHSYINQMW